MSTYIMYGYCPPPESKGQSGHFSCFVKGDITPEQIASVKASLLQGKYFFPSEVGLPEVRPNDQPETPGERFCLLHLNASFQPHNVSMDVEDMIHGFERQKDQWGSSRRGKYRPLSEIIRKLDSENSKKEANAYTKGFHDALAAVLQQMRLIQD